MDNRDKFLLEVHKLHKKMEAITQKYDIEGEVVNIMLTGMLDYDDFGEPVLKAVYSLDVDNEDLLQGIIRKIVIGRDPKDAMAYFVGMRVGNGKVVAIVLDDALLHRYSKMRYLVFLETDGAQVLWKAVDDMPCILEYDLNF